MTSKYDTTKMPQTDVLRVCLSCWRRVPSLFSRRILHHRFPTTSSLVCNNICGQRWSSVLLLNQRMMSSKTEEESDDIGSNPFYDKYKQKLKHLQEEKPEEFDYRLENLKAKKSQPQAEPDTDHIEPLPTPTTTSVKGTGPKSWPPKSLDEIMKLDLVNDLPPDTIKQLWQEYHLARDCIFSVVPTQDFEEIMVKSKLNPMFLFVLPKGDGHEFYLCQFDGKNIYFTPLSMYQLLKENAPPCLSVAHFTELKDNKGIVLMAGEYDDKIVKKTEALNLMKQMTLYYGKDSASRYKMLRTFNLQPEEFMYTDLIKEYNSNKEYLENNPY